MKLLDLFVGSADTALLTIFLQADLFLGIHSIFACDVIATFALTTFKPDGYSVIFFCHGGILTESDP